MSNDNIKIEFELRPCMINMVSNSLWIADKEIGIKSNERKALFHKWVEYENRMSLIDQKGIYGLIEYENGEVALVNPECIKFLDSPGLFDQYNWGIDVGSGDDMRVNTELREFTGKQLSEALNNMLKGVNDENKGN